MDGIAKFTCVCPAGFTGTKCDVDIDECSSSPCVHGKTHQLAYSSGLFVALPFLFLFSFFLFFLFGSS